MPAEEPGGVPFVVGRGLRVNSTSNEESPNKHSGKEVHMSVTTDESAGGPAIRPFTVEVPEAELEDLRARIRATRWPEKETVEDFSQGVQLAFIQALARYWATDYNWRRCEAHLNSHPQFVTEIDGLDIHFLYVRSRHEDAMPLIVTHGWPGSPIEQLKIIDPLTNPTAHGGSASDAFDVVIRRWPATGFQASPRRRVGTPLAGRGRGWS